jgi:L-fucono-1,5-lactonase
MVTADEGAAHSDAGRDAPLSRPTKRMVDAHVHVWDRSSPWMRWLDDRPKAWAPVRDSFSWARLRAELDAAGVADLVLVQAGTSTIETKMLLDLAEDQPSVIGVVGWVSLSSPKAAERDLESVDAPGTKLVGIRALHRWAPDGEILADPEVVQSCRLLADRGLPLDLFLNDHSELPLLLPILEAVPDGRFIIDHLGRPPIGLDATAQRLWQVAMTRLAQLPNVYVKFSGWGTNVARAVAADVRMYGDHVLATFGPGRTIYASNWPVALVAASYRDTFTATLEALSGLSPAGLEDVLGNTARVCYRPRSGGPVR